MVKSTITFRRKLCHVFNTIFKHFRSNASGSRNVEFPMPMTFSPAAEIAPLPHNRRRLFRWVLFLMSGALAAGAVALPSRAEESRTLVIPSNDGYGFDDCLKTGSECGLVVADAWCKAHGYGASKSFGPGTESSAEAAPGSYLVTCRDRVN